MYIDLFSNSSIHFVPLYMSTYNKNIIIIIIVRCIFAFFVVVLSRYLMFVLPYCLFMVLVIFISLLNLNARLPTFTICCVEWLSLVAIINHELT